LLPQKALALVWRPAKISVAQSMRDNKSSQPPVEENIDLTFYNDLTGKKDIPAKESVSEKEQSVSRQKDEEASKRNINIEAQKPPQTSTEKNTETEGTKTKKEADANIASHKNKFIVQVASLKEKSKADQMCKKILSLGFKAEIIKIATKNKGNMFRVITSGFENKVQAQDAAQKISHQTQTNCIVKSIDHATEKN
jgi:cell division septation protein DedD